MGGTLPVARRSAKPYVWSPVFARDLGFVTRRVMLGSGVAAVSRRLWTRAQGWALFACALAGCGKTSSTAPARESLSSSPVPSAKPASRAASVASTAPATTPSTAPDTAQPAFPLLADNCRQPRVAAANAPLSALARPGWNWPWVTQTLLAHETRFVFEPAQIAATRRVTLHQRELKAQAKVAGRAELIAACETPGTCNELAKVLRDSIPGNQATPYCATQPEPEPGLPLAWSTLLPPLPVSWLQGGSSGDVVAGDPDVDKACVRWAVCSHQQDPARPVDAGLACLKDPNRYQRERRCASGASCFDVAQCAGQSTRPGPELPLWRDFDAESSHREVFWLAGHRLYSPGGDPLGPSALYSQTVRDWETWQKQKSPGRWFIVGTGYEASNPSDDLGGGVRAMQSAHGTWQLQYVTLDGTIFGPTQTVSGDGDNVNLAPSFHSALGRAGEELLFDYDADGVPEVGVYQTSWHHTLPPRVMLSVWTVKQGRIVPYAPADEPAVGATDIDADGRPDLLLDSRDEYLGPEGNVQGHTSLDPDTAAHSLKDGTFSTKDAVAKRAAEP